MNSPLRFFAHLALSVVLLTSSTASVWAQTLPTNFELVQRAAGKAAAQLAAGLNGVGSDEDLFVRADGQHDGNFLVESTLSEALTQAGHTVHVGADSLGTVLEFQVVDLGIAYTRVHRPAWLGSRRVEREARARLFARLVDQQRAALLWSQQVDAKVVDEVPHSQLRLLEDRNGASYLTASMPERGWNKLVEPVVVSGIVIGLIALFFSNQDSSN